MYPRSTRSRSKATPSPSPSSTKESRDKLLRTAFFISEYILWRNSMTYDGGQYRYRPDVFIVVCGISNLNIPERALRGACKPREPVIVTPTPCSPSVREWERSRLHNLPLFLHLHVLKAFAGRTVCKESNPGCPKYRSSEDKHRDTRHCRQRRSGVPTHGCRSGAPVAPRWPDEAKSMLASTRGAATRKLSPLVKDSQVQRGGPRRRVAAERRARMAEAAAGAR